MAIQFEEFLRKATKKQEEKAKVIVMDIEDFGPVEFTRPETNYTLDFMEKIEKAEGFKESFELFKELLYTHCPILQKKELRDQIKVNSPYDLVPEIFGIQETAALANEYMEKFGFSSEEEDDDIKN